MGPVGRSDKAETEEEQADELPAVGPVQNCAITLRQKA
jgi:hypothetical protein